MRWPLRSWRRRGEHQNVARAEHAGVRRCLAVAVDDHAQRLPRRLDLTYAELRIILPHGANAGENRGRPSAPAMAVGAGGLSRDPLALSVAERGAAIEARGNLQTHPWPAGFDALDPTAIELTRFILEQANVDGDSGCSETICAMRRRPVRIPHCGHHACNAGGEQGIGAWRRARVMVAGFQRDVRGGASRLIAASSGIG